MVRSRGLPLGSWRGMPRGVVETHMVYADDENMDEAVSAAVSLLAKGEVVALPTETVYGLAASAFDAEAVAKVFEVKERPSFDPLIVHLARAEDLHQVAKLPQEIAPVVNKLIAAFWPGPLTLLLPKSEMLPELVTSGLPEVAVRQSANKVFRAVIKELGKPLAAPSANRFGRISPTSASAVMKELGGRIPLIVDGGACREGLESTIVRVEAGEKRPLIHILRLGPVTKKELQNFGKVQIVKKRVIDEQPEAPGQLSSHYAPRTPLLMFDKAEDFVPEPGKKYGLLSHKGDPKAGYVERHDWVVVECLSPGSGKLPEAAVRFFHLLRVLDEAGLDAIVAEPVSNTGLGQAIMDRLQRAALRKA